MYAGADNKDDDKNISKQDNHDNASNLVTHALHYEDNIIFPSQDDDEEESEVDLETIKLSFVPERSGKDAQGNFHFRN